MVNGGQWAKGAVLCNAAAGGNSTVTQVTHSSELTPRTSDWGICSPGCGYQLSFSWTKSVVRCSLQSVTNLSFGHFWLLEIPAYMNYYFIFRIIPMDSSYTTVEINKDQPKEKSKGCLFWTGYEVSLLFNRGVGRPSGAPCWPEQDVGRPTKASLPSKAGFSLWLLKAVCSALSGWFSWKQGPRLV